MGIMVVFLPFLGFLDEFGCLLSDFVDSCYFFQEVIFRVFLILVELSHVKVLAHLITIEKFGWGKVGGSLFGDTGDMHCSLEVMRPVACDSWCDFC